ncbi:ABC transporter ATP-binding protein [Paenalcaligenes hominis]|uniref:ABC transporter ATP-binding protein n=1 Tax=Paenalcaligenes hominis TaxID=643674 RepID=UPI003525EEB4
MKQLDRISVDIVNSAKTYPDGTQGLKPTNLHIHPGEVLALLGPSGCGKTTLLRMIAGLESADAGSQILFGDQDVTDKPVEQRNVGMVFQSYALFPQMSVQANIGYGLSIRGVPAAERKQRVGELVDLVHLNGLEHKRPSELSGGQRQRVALARAVAVRPRVLLLDEPLAALDAKLKETLRDELADLLRQLGITAIHVTHDQQEALAIADRLAVMHAGRIMQVGRGEDLYRDPSHAFVAEFLGRVNRISRSAEARSRHIIELGAFTQACPDALKNSQMLFVRPEDIQLTTPSAEVAKAKVIQRTFLGERIEFKVQLTDTQTLMVETHNQCPYQVGDTVGLTIPSTRFLNPEAE